MRFEIFKRDLFTCQYCGATPPDAVLHVDHIVAIANGGRDDLDNLTTSCKSCNLGKSSKPITDIPQSLKNKAEDIAEREAQLLGYYKIIEAKRERIDTQSWRICDAITPGSSKKGVPRDWSLSIKRFIEAIGFHEALAAAEIALAKKPYWSDEYRFKYFCGICWRKIKEADRGSL